MAARFLIGQKLDDDPWLPTAVGAAIEVHAQVLAARGERVEALAYLREQFKAHAATSLSERIRKNINLLTLEGKPAPELETAPVRRRRPPPSLAGLRGRPVLLFFWAHWCSDCKAEVDILAALRQTFAKQRPGDDRSHATLWLCGGWGGGAARHGKGSTLKRFGGNSTGPRRHASAAQRG